MENEVTGTEPVETVESEVSSTEEVEEKSE